MQVVLYLSLGIKGFGVSGLGFRVWGLGFYGFRIYGLGFRVGVWVLFLRQASR